MPSTHPRFLTAAVLPLGLLTALSAAPDRPRDFENDDDFVCWVTEFSASSELDYTENDHTHEVEMTCLIRLPEGEDVVCVLEQLSVASVEDDEGDDIYLPPRRGRSQRDDERTYVAFVQGVAEVELKSAQLSRPAYTVEEMVIATEVIVAEERGDFELRAIVSDDELDTPYQTSVRLSEMKIGRDHVAEIVIEYDRENTPGAPLPEAVYALDEDGQVLGGGRWTEGVNIFSETGEFEAEFLVTDDADVTTLRLVFLTEYEVVPQTFEITDVFQD